ncbi:hypothetical protein [Thalassospira lucentensis]|uniref:hypothetical protein n=1 Tax=Thalassospira lucentensis TaxID=168935 RepID=UPI003AA85CC1
MQEESWLLKNAVALIAVLVSVVGWIVTYKNSDKQFQKARKCSKIDAAEKLVHDIADEAIAFWTSSEGSMQDQIRHQRIIVMLKRLNNQVKLAYANGLPVNYEKQLKSFRQACTYVSGSMNDRTTYKVHDKKVTDLSDMSLSLIECIDLT